MTFLSLVAFQLGGRAPWYPPGYAYVLSRAWYGMEDGIEWKGNFGMEYGRCQNGMKWKISRMEWKTIFHTNPILDFAHGIYRKMYIDSDN